MYQRNLNKKLKLHLGSDIYFYAKRSEGLFIDTLIPISDEEAGVRDIR